MLGATTTRRGFGKALAIAGVVIVGAAIFQAIQSSDDVTKIKSNCRQGAANCHLVRLLAEWWLPGRNPTDEDPLAETVDKPKAGAEVTMRVGAQAVGPYRDPRPGVRHPPLHEDVYMVDISRWLSAGTPLYLQAKVPDGVVVYDNFPSGIGLYAVFATCVINVDGKERMLKQWDPASQFRDPEGAVCRWVV